MKSTTKLDFTGQIIYTGLDVHKKNWSVSIHTKDFEHKTFSQPPDPQVLVSYLKRTFPDATYQCVYEAGYCGFWIHDALCKEGIECIVINPADVPTTNKERKQKRDKVDCRKLARSLKNGDLISIYVPSRANLEDRMLMRTRVKLIENRTRCKNRIKAVLSYYGINIPEEMDTGKWSKRFIQWLRSIDFEQETGRLALDTFLSELAGLEKILKTITDKIKLMSKTDRYADRVRNLKTIPGIGLVIAMTILTEIEDINRFKKIDQLCSFIGLVPNVYASSDTEHIGAMTKRGNNWLKTMIIESAWIAVKKDPSLLLYYQQLTKRMKSSKAIVRVARKLVNRMRYVLKNNQPYIQAISV
ncbi:MAG TPA: IS110 family transposase [Bacteroidales bacterium]|nr:IS110 family transposase [Bacteroidales bacterium]